MTIQVVPFWPFLRLMPSESELRAREAVKKFERVERRALATSDDRISDLQAGITELTDRARALETLRRRRPGSR